MSKIPTVNEGTLGVSNPTQMIGGVPWSAEYSLKEHLDVVVNKTLAEVYEVRAIGVEPLRIVFPAPESPARIYIKFPTDRPQWEVRKKLDDAMYDVGQKLGPNELAFYVIKRREKSKGWSE